MEGSSLRSLMVDVPLNSHRDPRLATPMGLIHFD